MPEPRHAAFIARYREIHPEPFGYRSEALAARPKCCTAAVLSGTNCGRCWGCAPCCKCKGGPAWACADGFRPAAEAKQLELPAC